MTWHEDHVCTSLYNHLFSHFQCKKKRKGGKKICVIDCRYKTKELIFGWMRMKFINWKKNSFSTSGWHMLRNLYHGLVHCALPFAERKTSKSATWNCVPSGFLLLYNFFYCIFSWRQQQHLYIFNYFVFSAKKCKLCNCCCKITSILLHYWQQLLNSVKNKTRVKTNWTAVVNSWTDEHGWFEMFQFEKREKQCRQAFEGEGSH